VRRGVFRVVVVLAVGVALLLATWTVQAHGGGTPQLVRQPVGPYLLSVWTQPDPPRVGALHMTTAVFVSDGESDTPVLDAGVFVMLQPPGDEPPLRRLLSRGGAAYPGYYEADVELSTTGRWQATVIVSGPEGGGQAAFDLDVRSAQRVSPLVWGGLGLLVVLGWWFWQMRGTEDEV